MPITMDIKAATTENSIYPSRPRFFPSPLACEKRIQKGVEDYVGRLLELLNARNTAPMVMEAIYRTQSADPGPVAQQIEDPRQWTNEKITGRALSICSDKGPQGDFDD
jgi:hypothetical protein